MEKVLNKLTLNEKGSIYGTLELIGVMTGDTVEYDITYSMNIPDPSFFKINKRYNVARIKTEKSAQKFYKKQMKKLIEEGVLNYFYDLEAGAI